MGLWFVICIFEKKVTISNLLINITYFFEVAPFIFCLINLKKLKTKERRVFFAYTLFVAVFILLAFTARSVFHSRTAAYIVARIYDVIEYSLLSYFFSLNTKNAIVKRITLFTIIPFIGYCIYDYLSAKVPGFAFVPLVIEGLTLLIVLIYIFYEKMQYSLDIAVHQTSFFWVAVAFVVYFAGSFFLFLYSKNSYQDDSFRNQYTIIYSVVTISKDILLCISTFVKDKDKTPQSSVIQSPFDSFLPFTN